MKKITAILIILTSVSCSTWGKKPLPFDRKKWIEDFDYIEKSMSEAYPNFDAYEAKKLSLLDLDKITREKLTNSNSDAESLQILENFIKQFGDGHLRLKKVQHSTVAKDDSVKSINGSMPGLEVCKKLMDAGYKNFNFQFPMPMHLGFTKPIIYGDVFQTSILSIGQQKIGFLRISSFGQGNYPDLCADEWHKFQKPGQSCDKECQENFIYIVLAKRLLKELEGAVESLNVANVSSLVVDLSGNGGGTDWVSAAIRMLTNKPIKCGQFGFIKHPHWVKIFNEQKEEILTVLQKTSDTKIKNKLNQKISTIESDLQEARKSCDRSSIWTEKVKPKCSLVVKKIVSDCKPSDEYQFREGLFRKRLFILVDQGTASAAEDMASRLKESRAATILGSNTLGSGCGYVNDPIPFILPNSGMKLVMPNCVRYSRKGVNEVLGVEPDVQLPVQDMKSEVFTKALVEYLKINSNLK